METKLPHESTTPAKTAKADTTNGAEHNHSLSATVWRDERSALN